MIEETPKVAPRMSFDELDVLMTYMVRRESVFLQARNKLRTEHFSQTCEAGHRLIWQCLLNYYNVSKTLPPRELLESSVSSHIGAANTFEAELVGHEVWNFFSWVYDVDISAWQDADGFSILQRYLYERDVLDPLREHLDSLGSRVVPADFSLLLKEISGRVTQITAVASNPISNLFPDSWGVGDDDPIPLGLDFMDALMCGGPYRTDVVGILGAMGAGKSTLARQLAISAANRELSQIKPENPDYVPGEIYYAGYEEPKDQVLRKMISCAARIELKRIRPRTPGWLESLSTIHNPDSIQDYERSWIIPGKPGLAELERLNVYARPLTNLVHEIDLSGMGDNRAGLGYVDELAAFIERAVRERPHPIRLIILDYAMLMARRYIRVKGWDETRHMRTLIGSVGDDCRFQLANRFNCTVVVLHQLSGDANTRAATAKFSHADAAESKMFAENLSYCFELSTKDETAGCVVLRVSKTRHSESKADPVILTYTGYNHLLETNKFMIDTAAHKIVEKTTGEIYGTGRKAKAPKPSASSSSKSAVRGIAE